MQIQFEGKKWNYIDFECGKCQMNYGKQILNYLPDEFC